MAKSKKTSTTTKATSPTKLANKSKKSTTSTASKSKTNATAASTKETKKQTIPTPQPVFANKWHKFQFIMISSVFVINVAMVIAIITGGVIAYSELMKANRNLNEAKDTISRLTQRFQIFQNDNTEIIESARTVVASINVDISALEQAAKDGNIVEVVQEKASQIDINLEDLKNKLQTKIDQNPNVRIYLAAMRITTQIQTGLASLVETVQANTQTALNSIQTAVRNIKTLVIRLKANISQSISDVQTVLSDKINASLYKLSTLQASVSQVSEELRDSINSNITDITGQLQSLLQSIQNKAFVTAINQATQLQQSVQKIWDNLTTKSTITDSELQNMTNTAIDSIVEVTELAKVNLANI
jgi:translation initiation factor 2 beta subunit (eIF-2beta)/eIF-5